jgi:hypothetical protein
MKKLFALLVCALLMIPSAAWCDGTCVITHGKHNIEKSSPTRQIRQLIFTCVGDVVNGSIPNKEISAADLDFIRGWCLKKVEAYPTAGGVAPALSSIFILDADGMDLLGSEDGSTTPYAGLYMIHPTLKRKCYPNTYLTRAGLHTNWNDRIVSLLTLKVIDQDTASAEYVVVLTLEKE